MTKTSITERQQKILDLLYESEYITVSKLSEVTFTSESSIRRDLERLQKMNLLKRTHGGASLIENTNKATPLDKRMTKNTVGKRKIAKKAQSLIRDGMTVMLDGSSTASFLVPYISKFKDITLYTNNMKTALSAISYGIRTHCIGGSSVNSSAVLSGEESYLAVMSICPDILFFSSQSLSRDGIISDSTESENYLRKLMIKNAKTTVFLCDCEKFSKKSTYILASADDIDFLIFDEIFPSLKTKSTLI